MAMAMNTGPQEVGVGVDTADQDDEGRTRAHHQRVGKDSQSLYQSLFHGVAHGSCGRSVRRTALTGLVGEETALHAVHDRCSHHASGSLVQSEGILNDHSQHMGNQLDVHQDDDHCQYEVAHGHHWYQYGTDTGDALDAAEDDDERQHRQHGSGHHGVPPEGSLHGAADGVGLH